MSSVSLIPLVTEQQKKPWMLIRSRSQLTTWEPWVSKGRTHLLHVPSLFPSSWSPFWKKKSSWVIHIFMGAHFSFLAKASMPNTSGDSFVCRKCVAREEHKFLLFAAIFTIDPEILQKTRSNNLRGKRIQINPFFLLACIDFLVRSRDAPIVRADFNA